jgi:hypothetical protein
LQNVIISNCSRDKKNSLHSVYSSPLPQNSGFRFYLQ